MIDLSISREVPTERVWRDYPGLEASSDEEIHKVEASQAIRYFPKSLN